jgi:hypothetical protein
MDSAHIVFWAALVLFCLWSAILARLKGYSAVCWLFAGGMVGVALLCRLPPARSQRAAKRRRANRLGLLLSGASLLLAGLARKFL